MNPHALKSALPRTWGAFFGRHGNFTPAQLAAIPLLLEGHNVLLCAPTAGGKTEATLAPLIERRLPARREAPRLTVLYLLPTRALIADLQARLHAPLEALRVSTAVKTHDFNTFDPRRPADLLLTTPEAFDALLAGHAQMLARVRAVVIDELHTFEGTVRGDQLRVLLNRLREVRSHAARVGDAQDASIQFAALSATLAQPEAAAGRYFAGARVVRVPGRRPVHADYVALDKGSPAALLDYLDGFRSKGWRKALAFCNTRAEVESYAAAVRAARSPFGENVYVHYSNLEWERRSEIEREYAQAQVAICFASSTLELGIDIGDIDVALLIGPPGSVEAFVQRVGRAARRRQTAHVACFSRTPLERIIFGALLSDHDQEATGRAFRPAVAVQQIFSLLKQSPTGAVRLAPLAGLFDGMLSTADLETILGHLQAQGYLKSGRAGEWRAGERLNHLYDMQSAEHSPLSPHSNIGSGPERIKIRDQLSNRVVAGVDRQWFARDLLTLEGRPVNVQWYDGESLWVSAYRGGNTAAQLRYRSERQVMSYDLARLLPTQVGLAPSAAPLVPHDKWSVAQSSLWFHWLGDVYGRAVLGLMGHTLRVHETPQPGLCLLALDEPHEVPSWTPEQVNRHLQDHYRRYEPLMALGAYHDLLPTELRRRAVIEQFDVARFLQAVGSLHIERAPEALTVDLRNLVGLEG